MTRVKICGLRTVEHALAAAGAGAAILGFMFAPSRRQLTPECAAAIIREVRAAQHMQAIQCVGLFVNEQPARMLSIVEQCGLDAVQLSGDEPISILAALPHDLPILKAVRLQGAPEEQDWLESDYPHVRLLVDAHVPGSYGGTGTVADWDRAAALARQRPLMLAGGLTPENVAAAIRQVRPWAVDVSSGVETDGIKDCTKISAFIAAARSGAEHMEISRQ
ncbi:MAG TPA: phosphoribosylanthranilate isomerase [Roseiflexaceae bacterium]|jgi:phosphoribosylanthranilate isomerase|nr:phosphoribosylanthranilate isomerase [Roseiflexaceae bacterium]